MLLEYNFCNLMKLRFTRSVIALPITLCLLSFGPGDARRTTAAATNSSLKNAQPNFCRSNDTHIAWTDSCDEPSVETKNIDKKNSNYYSNSWISTSKLNLSTTSRKILTKIKITCNDDDDDDESSCSCCTWQSRTQAEEESYHYLRAHVMAMDLLQLQTLGFNNDDDDDDDDDDGDDNNNTDGLDAGLIGPTITYALNVKVNFSYTDALPLHIWREYVLNYANVNEARSNWRPLLHHKLYALATAAEVTGGGIPEVVMALNRHMWTILAPNNNNNNNTTNATSIIFVLSQTPLIFDTMSVLAFGYASCTGLAILFVNALRSVGVPARLAGTPAWYQIRSQGNHNWVEVWDHGQWYFLEPSPAQSTVDHLKRDPCERWFCNKSRFGPDMNNTTKVTAARLQTTTADTFFRLAWEWKSMSVPGEDVTAYYQSTCSVCN